MSPIINTAKVLAERKPDDFYPTPDALCKAALQYYGPLLPPARVLDPGAGAGPWGAAVVARYGTRSAVMGVELRSDAQPHAGYRAWHTADFLTWTTPVRFDLVCGNPPYKHAEAFVRRSLDLLAPGGVCVLLLRLAFLEGQARGRGLWREHPPTRVGVLTQRPSFIPGGGTDATAYALYQWQQGVRSVPRLEWISWKPGAAAHQLRLVTESP